MEIFPAKPHDWSWPRPPHPACLQFILPPVAMRRIPDVRQPPRLHPELLQTWRRRAVTDSSLAHATLRGLSGRRKATNERAPGRRAAG